MVECKKTYRFIGDGRPLGEGGHAKVWQAEHKITGEIVALKQAHIGTEPQQRIRREIDVQKQLEHKNIMNILESDPDHKWFTMPLAKGSVYDLRPKLTEENLFKLVRATLSVLAYAHEIGYRHRDISPKNILAVSIPKMNRRRWVLADWGSVARPRGQTSRHLTGANSSWGTDGFAAPETYTNAHEATASADIYSVGQIIGWFLTNEWPAPNHKLLPDGRWRSLVRDATASRPEARPTAIQLLTSIDDLEEEGEVEDDQLVIQDIAASYREMNPSNKPNRQDVTKLAAILGDAGNNELIMLDEVPRLPHALISSLARFAPDVAAHTAESCCRHLRGDTWGTRSYDYLETVFGFILETLQSLESVKQVGEIEDVTDALLPADIKWQRFGHRRAFRKWVDSLSGDAADAVGRALKRHPEAADWHLQEGWRPSSTNATIRSAYAR